MPYTTTCTPNRVSAPRYNESSGTAVVPKQDGNPYRVAGTFIRRRPNRYGKLCNAYHSQTVFRHRGDDRPYDMATSDAAIHFGMSPEKAITSESGKDPRISFKFYTFAAATLDFASEEETAPESEATDFVTDLITACRSPSRMHEAVDMVNDFFSTHLGDGDFETCNTALRCFLNVTLPRTVAVMVLVVTAHLPSTQLPARDPYYRAVITRLLPAEDDPRNRRYLESLA